MESGGKQLGSSSSSPTYSLASDLFGSKDSSSSSSEVLGSIFAPSTSKVIGRDALGIDAGGKEQDTQHNLRKDNSSQGREVEARNEYKSLDSIFDGEDALAKHACHFSSSIYYGGQDMYTPQGSQSSTSVTHKKDWEEEDPRSAARGNWWEGSVYY